MLSFTELIIFFNVSENQISLFSKIFKKRAGCCHNIHKLYMIHGWIYLWTTGKEGAGPVL
jgi:hypothetical protein